jgi:D-alanyl-D-alanine carboxypeptidase
LCKAAKVRELNSQRSVTMLFDDGESCFGGGNLLTEATVRHMKRSSSCRFSLLTVAVSFSILLHPLASPSQSKGGAKPGAEAAQRNVVMSTSLVWTFGSKRQLGWYLYTPLIQQLIDTKRDPSSVEFARAVAHWQTKSALKPSGVIDEETLYAMIKTWQEARLKDRTPAQPAQLLTAPISDFYDPTRAEELRQVERQTYEAYKRMVAAAVGEQSLGLAHKGKELAPGEKYLKIISAFRAREYQEKLRRESPTSGSAGLAVNSPHFTGRALDLYVGGDPVETKDANRAFQVRTLVYLWLVRNAGRFGFRPYCYEPWHWEYVGR